MDNYKKKQQQKKRHILWFTHTKKKTDNSHSHSQNTRNTNEKKIGKKIIINQIEGMAE